MIDPSDAYDRRVAHAETIKVVNNRYSIPVTLKFAAVTKERTVNIAQKHVIIFAAIKLLDPTAIIKSTKGIVYHHPKDFPCSQAYQDAFEVIVDKNTHPKPHIYVKHIIESTLQINQIKYGSQIIMNTLHQQQAFIQFRKYSTHREACIGWFKYISTSITLQSSAKLRVDNLLKTAHLSANEIESLTTTNHKSVTGSTDTTSRKRTGDHDDNDEWKEIVFPAYDLHMRRISFGNGDKRISTIAFEV